MGYVYIVLAAVLWGLIGPASRFALRDGVDPLEIAFWRAVIAAACFGAHAVALRRTRIARRDLPAVIVFGLLGVSLLYAAVFLAVRHGGAALASVLLYTAPVWVAVLAALFLHERMTGRKLLAVFLAMAGVAGIATASGGSGIRLTAPALFWGLLSGWAYALFYLFGKRYFDRYPAATLFMYALPVGALGLLPLVDFRPKTPVAWTAIVFLAVVPTYASYLLYSAGLRRVEATRAATVATIEPVVAAVSAYLVWGERMSVTGYLFAGLVLLAVLLMVSGDGKTETDAPPGGS
ncbi:MAG TPA: EamA family transporter [Longimicrobium sp.]|nr:EamA family transporter [Longimicrobium sp.]